MVRIRFQQLSIGNILQSSGVFSGDNLQLQWRSVRKSNDGFGEITGDRNVMTGHINVILDDDVRESWTVPKRESE